MGDEEVCCPRFDPEPWDETEVTWQDKLFLKERVRSIFHIPINFGAVMRRSMTRIMAAGAQAGPEEMVVLSDENSLWGADIYIAVSKEVPGAEMATLSGTFLCKVFEGPYSQMRKWIAQMKQYVGEKGGQLSKLYFFYTTCPKCVKKYGKNYVVLLAQT
ncbi:MAG: hydrolase [Planctomycetota bacterium]|jgi:hypothetical protein